MKKILIGILQTIGAFVYSVVASYLLWIFFKWATPYVMGAGWLQFIFYCFGALAFVLLLSLVLSPLLAKPTKTLSRNNWAAKIIVIPAVVYFGYLTLKLLPWTNIGHLHLLQWLLIAVLAATEFFSFVSIITNMYAKERKTISRVS